MLIIKIKMQGIDFSFNCSEITAIGARKDVGNFKEEKETEYRHMSMCVHYKM